MVTVTITIRSLRTLYFSCCSAVTACVVVAWWCGAPNKFSFLAPTADARLVNENEIDEAL